MMNIQQDISVIQGLPILHAHLEGFIASTTANAYWKDSSGKYLGANQWQVQRSGAQSYANLIGAIEKIDELGLVEPR